MQLTNAQKVLARKELLEALLRAGQMASDVDSQGLPITQLRATKTFRYRKELSDKQVEQLLDATPPVVEVQLKMSAYRDGLRYEKFYKLTDAGLRVIAAMHEVREKLCIG